jgi:hypothetical protein
MREEQMIDSAQGLRGMNSDLPDWLRDELAEEDPVFYDELRSEEPVYVSGDRRQPHTIRGFDAAEMAHGFHITSSPGYFAAR